MSDFRIHGRILLPASEQAREGVAIVGLDDVTVIDSLSRRIAEQVIDPLPSRATEIRFSLQVPASLVLDAASYSLAAEIRTSSRKSLSPGDYLSTVSHPWSPGDDAEHLIQVQRI